jgi:predicted transposase/invertase (TIGR01784 family)
MTPHKNPHDRFFRRTFGDRELALEYLRHYLPPEVRQQLDLDTLRLTSTSLVDEELAEHQNDLLYEVATTAGQELYLYILIEHKSYPDKWVLLQLLRYMVKLWQKEVAEGHTGNTAVLRPILPLIVYHGYPVWPFSTNFADYFASASPAIQPYLPQFTAVLHDLSVTANQEIAGTPSLQALLLALRHILDQQLAERFEWFIRTIFAISQEPHGYQLLQLIVYYYGVATTKINRQEMERVLKLQGNEGEKLMRTVAMEYQEEALEKGRQEGAVVGQQQAVLSFLKARFMVVPAFVELRLKQVQDTAVLNSAITQAAQVTTLDEFITWLEQTTP